jgi:hypothetical protein
MFNLLSSGRRAGCGHDHACDGSVDPHHHSSGEIHPIVGFLLMMAPICASTAWTRDEYSPATLARKGLYDAPTEVSNTFLSTMVTPLTREMIESQLRKTADGYYQFNLMELFFSAGDKEMQSLVDGMKIETEGRFIEDRSDNAAPTRRRLYRLFITCCAADSRAIPIILEFNAAPPSLPENEWCKVAGTMRFPLENNVIQAVLEVERIDVSDPPFEESFLRR